MRFAVIDLGTNTFHLLIVDRDGEEWRTVHRERIFVRLAEEGIHLIGPAAYERGLAAVEIFREHLIRFGIPPEGVPAFGTAALRTAANAPDFLREVQRRTGIVAEVIGGEREALLIYQGVRQAVPFPDHPVLVMDIGGGSVEFILADRSQVFWHRSFPVGVAVLYRQFHKKDPIAPGDIAAVEQFLDDTLVEFWAALAQYPTATLVGAAGAFDIIDHLLLDPATKPLLYGWIPASGFLPLYNHIINSSLLEREQMHQLSPERREMVVVGMILIRYVLERGGLKEIYTSVYSMKEGMLAEL
jgi:exopolyphosphatase/guanosine-5'-triphosphate,3'-diphosphate pyrophosphatase